MWCSSVQRGDEAKLSIGHSIGDRSHIIDKKRDKDGRIRQQQRFVNLNEHEAGEFNNEFKTRASKFFTGDASGSRQQAIENGHHHHSRNGLYWFTAAELIIITVSDLFSWIFLFLTFSSVS